MGADEVQPSEALEILTFILSERGAFGAFELSGALICLVFLAAVLRMGCEKAKAGECLGGSDLHPSKRVWRRGRIGGTCVYVQVCVHTHIHAHFCNSKTVCM